MKVQPPPAMPGIKRVTVIRILGITFTNNLSTAEHVHNVITLCAQTLYALKVLRAHGMSDSAIQSVYRAVIISKLMYGSYAWWGFASPTDRQRIQAFIRRSERSRFTPPDLPSFIDLCREADNNLLDSILNNSHHVLRHLLPPPSQASRHYSLRSRRHNLPLSIGPTSLSDRNFLHRMLYILTHTDIFYHPLYMYNVAFCQRFLILNEVVASYSYSLLGNHIGNHICTLNLCRSR